PLFGEVLMGALWLEHNGIRGDISTVESLVTNRLEGLSQTDLLSRKTTIQQAIDALSQRVDTHTSEEEVVLKMLEKALEAEGQGKGYRALI
ncbi:MAG: hypothetical protein Q7R40_14510, partial [Phaeospirillum sp.]|nr:hypothetical protein [Phaeospirillum sp.]